METSSLLNRPPERWIASLIEHSHGRLYRFPHDLVLRRPVSPREARLMVAAGDLTMPVASWVLREVPRPGSSNRSSGGNTNTTTINTSSRSNRGKRFTVAGAIMVKGERLRWECVDADARPEVLNMMLDLVRGLHRRGIVHGNIHPEAFIWHPDDGSLRLVDFSCGRELSKRDPKLWWDKSAAAVGDA